jgi:flagellin
MPVIATNTSANSALFYLNRNSQNQSDSLAKISSGSRIVNSSDDAAGLAVSDQLRADISALTVASRTVQQASALLQTADGGAARIGDILQRMKALGTQFSSGTLDATSQAFINDEYEQLGLEIDLIVASTEYNGQALLDGTYTGTAADVVVGTDAANHQIDLDLAAVDIDVAGLTIAAATTGFTTGGIAAELTAIDAAITEVGTARATIGALTAAVKFQGENVNTQLTNIQAAKSTITDVDIAREQTNFTNYQVLTEAAISGLSKSNEMKQSLLSLLR